MNVGDRVFIYNEKVYGVIKKVLASNFLIIDTEEGFSCVEHVSAVNLLNIEE